MSAYKNIVLIGASGSVGSIILDGLISASSFNITVLSRTESQAEFPATVALRKTDFSKADLINAFKGQDAVISAVGANAFSEQKKIVDAAVEAGVKRFIPSEFSASSQDPAVQQLLPLFVQKADLIEYLRQQESSGLSWTGLATSGLFDWGLANGFLEMNLKTHTATVWDDGNKRFTLTNEKQVGQAVVSVLQRPQETQNQYLYVASVETSQNEVLAALEDATNTKWTINKVTTREQIDEAMQKLGAGDFSGAFTLVRASVFSNVPELHSNYAKDESLANDILGLKLEDVESVVRRVAAC